MPTTFHKPLWRQPHILWPIAALIFLSATAGLALIRAGASRIMVVNETGRSLSALTIKACGTTRTFAELQADESIRIKLARSGLASEILLATNGVVLWRGEYVDPHSGQRILLRLLPDGLVESGTTTSCWNQFQSTIDKLKMICWP